MLFENKYIPGVVVPSEVVVADGSVTIIIE